MPRYKVAENQTLFDLLLSLLDYEGEVGSRALEAINMLTTNPVLYRNVLSLNGTSIEEKFNWSLIFDDTNVHKMLYSLEIVESLLLRDENEEESRDWARKFIILGGL